jgi:hypothetical protein
MSIEAMKQALEALVKADRISGHPNNKKTINALRAALAQQEQEPVAWMVYTLDGKSVCVTDNPQDFAEQHRALPLYTHPPRREWVGLTEEERLSLIAYEPHPLMNRTAIVHAVEAKLKEKNHE